MVPVMIIIFPLPQRDRAFMRYKLLYEMATVRKAQYKDGLYHSSAEIAILSSGLGLSAMRLRKR
jgi:hypothetical protein